MSADQRVAIKAVGLSKTFRLPHEARNTVRDYVLHPLRRTTFEEQRALVDVSFSIRAGEFFGVIGRNGSGKSTLLKLLAQIYRPDSGRVEINGKLSPFIELGVGFNPELNARDNIRINGTLLGLTPAQLENRFDDIVGFAELERFVDQKLKNYSSGMQLRLAYSIAIQVPFDILLLDEVLAVGDQNFQDKCFATFEAMREEGKTVVLVTHDLRAVERFCNRSLLLRDGVVQAVGSPEEVAQIYLEQERERAAAAATGNGGGPPGLGAEQVVRTPRSPGETQFSREDIESMTTEEIRQLVRSQQKHLDLRQARLEDLSSLSRELKETQREVTQLTAMIDILSERHYPPAPVPPEPLRARMSTRSSVVNFLAQGLLASQQAVLVFGESPQHPLLEWGCGNGRAARWLIGYPAWREHYRGCDTDTEAIAWAAENVGADVAVCGNEPPLPYADQTFGGVFALGMLTHIHPELHRHWYAELHRLLRAGARALLGTQGPSRVRAGRSGEEGSPAQHFRDRGWAFIEPAGGVGAAFVGDDFVRETAAGLFKIEEYRPLGHGLTDVYVLERCG